MTIAALMLLNSNIIFAAEQGSNPYVCNQNDLPEISDKRNFKVGAGSKGSYPSILAETQSIKINQQNTTIEVWTTWVGSQRDRSSMMLPTFGKMKRLYIIDYRTMKINMKYVALLNCDGSIIMDREPNSWDDIVPGSIEEQITQSIVEKYKLK